MVYGHVSELVESIKITTVMANISFSNFSGGTKNCFVANIKCLLPSMKRVLSKKFYLLCQPIDSVIILALKMGHDIYRLSIIYDANKLLDTP